MSDGKTVERSVRVLPVKSIRVEVERGPGAGRVVESIAETLTVGSADTNDLVLDHPTVSRFHVELTRTRGGIGVRDLGSTNGTWVGHARVEVGRLKPGALLELGDVALRVQDAALVDVEAHAAADEDQVVGRAPAMQRLLARADRAATSEASVLILGESGSGKEVIARSIHERSGRADGPFVVVDCASLSPTLVGSALFGHERGAFTGADRRRAGAFERAAGGTVFLDEIGELPDDLAPSLLGVLERRRFHRLGGSEEVEADVRVLAATHRDLREAVNSGRFRLDLYYRLAVVTLTVPRLRDRAQDIPSLVERFAAELGDLEGGRALLDPVTKATLERHTWPGNVRELRNWVEAALAMGEVPHLAPLGPDADDGADALLAMPWKDARRAVVERLEKRYLASLMEECDGNLSAAGRRAGIDRNHLATMLRRHGLR